VVEGVAGFPRVWGEGVVGEGGGNVVKNDGLGGIGVVVVGGAHFDGLWWYFVSVWRYVREGLVWCRQVLYGTLVHIWIGGVLWVF